VILAIAVAGSIILTVSNQRDSFLEETSRSLSVTSQILNDVIRNTMLAGEAPIAVRTVADLQTNSEFADIAIFRRDGTNAFHDDATINTVNANLGMKEFEVTDRAELRTMSNADFQHVLDTNTPVLVQSMENRTAEFYFPLLNYADCRVCHGTDHFIRGVAYFRVSTDRIFNEIDRTRNTLTLFFVGAGIVLAGIIIFMLRRIVLQPVLSIGATVNDVGQGNLDASVSVQTRDELGRLATQINSMITGLKEKNRLEVENRVIEAKNEENRKYLDNINEGLLLLDSSHRISEQYSSFLEELFGSDRIAGRMFSEFIYPNEIPESELRSDLDQFVDLIFSSTSTDMEMIASINPLSDKHIMVGTGAEKREIVVDASFQRIMDGDHVQNVMVIFVDKTELVRVEAALETERLRSETEIEQIAAILRSGPESFQEFAADADKTLRMLHDNVALDGGAARITELFRELHSLKGAARYMELRSFAQSLNETEDIVAAVRDGRQVPGPDVTSRLSRKLDELYEGVDAIKRINERFKEFTSSGAGSDGSVSRSDSVRSFFDNVERMVMSLAKDLDKKVRLRTSTDFETLPVLPKVQNSIIHIVRNALDHGIEEGIERVAAGKTEKGTVQMSVSREDDNRCRIEVRDDGRGIDFKRVQARAEEQGLVGPGASTNDLLKVLFSPAFSSRSEATDISGRGVGLDAVQSAVRSLGGSISVGTREGVGTKFTIRIPTDRREE